MLNADGPGLDNRYANQPAGHTRAHTWLHRRWRKVSSNEASRAALIKAFLAFCALAQPSSASRHALIAARCCFPRSAGQSLRHSSPSHALRTSLSREVSNLSLIGCANNLSFTLLLQALELRASTAFGSLGSLLKSKLINGAGADPHVQSLSDELRHLANRQAGVISFGSRSAAPALLGALAAVRALHDIKIAA